MHAKHLLSLFFGASSLALGYATVCNDKRVIESTLLTMASGHVVTMERFNCSSIIGDSGAASARREPPQAMRSLDLRAATQCTEANCMCGIPCFFDLCLAVNPGQTIHAADCTALGNSLMNNPGTFIIPPGQGLALILSSCEYVAFGPSTTENVQYCFSDMGIAALQVFAVCGSTQQGVCKGSFLGGNFFIDQLSV